MLSNLIITVISGVLVFVLGQCFLEFRLRPIQEYKKLKAKVAKMLVLYACYYSNPLDPNETARYSDYENASNEMRMVASEVAAYAEIKPNSFSVLFCIPTKKKLIKASGHLIGISNSFFVSKNAEGCCTERVTHNAEKVKKYMRISR